MQSLRFLTAALVVALSASVARAQTVLFSDDFETSTANWTVDDPWHRTSACSPTMPSGQYAMYFGLDASCNFNGVPDDFRRLVLAQPFTIATGAERTVIDFQSRSGGEDDAVWDLRQVQVTTDNGNSWTTLRTLLSSNWQAVTVDLSAYAGQTIQVAFSFWSGDSTANLGLGWMIDDVVVSTEAPHATFCHGDGSAAACPCGNASAPGDDAGCLNSFGYGGRLRAFHVASISNDSLQLAVSQISNHNNQGLIFQAANVASGGQGFVFGDGIKCTAGPFIRIASRQAFAGTIYYPVGNEAPVSVRGNVTTPGVRYYQAHYRSAHPTFCTPDTFNYTNGVIVNWQL
jgi:hypothetical protein